MALYYLHKVKNDSIEFLPSVATINSGCLLRVAPLGRIGTPEDIAMAAEFLVGPQSMYITGTDLVVDGGVSALVEYGTEIGFRVMGR